MARKFNLRDFQTDLSKRLQLAAQTPTQVSRLGFQAANVNWLIALDEIDEVMPIPEIEPTPGTMRWFKGVANIRGNLYAVSDMTDFMIGSPTQPGNETRLLLTHRKHGVNAAFIVQRAMGLRQSGQLIPGAAGGTARAFSTGTFVEPGGATWYELDLAGLLAAPTFLSVEETV